MLMMLVFLAFNSTGWCESGFTQKDRELLIELRTRMLEIDKRFEQVDKRFTELREDMNKRFEQMDKRFEQVDKRFEQMMNTLWILAAIFTAIVVGTIGFALWDRRTMIRPFETKVTEMDKKIENNQQINQTLIAALKDFAATNKRFAEILKRFNLF